MKQMIREISRELTEHILPFWRGLRDDERGGYISRVDYDLTRHPEAVKGCILNSRILWFFSQAAMQLGDPALLAETGHAYEMLKRMADEMLIARIRPLLLSMADQTWRETFSDHGFSNECERGRGDTKRIWWVQAEAVLGFLNAWQRTGEERYRQAVLTQWAFIRDVLVDRREGSEWYWYVNEDGTPGDRPIVEPWKCPYHNGRMALEVLRRAAAITKEDVQ